MEELVDEEVFDATIKLNFGMLIIGAPGTGKSTFIKKLLLHRDRVLSEHVDYIVYFYGQMTRTVREIAEELPDEVRLVAELPEDFSDFIQPHRRGIFVFDDLMESVSNSRAMVELATKKRNHENLSFIICLQNAFHHGKERTSLTRSANYIVLFKSPLDRSVPQILAHRIMPNQRNTFLDIFEEATRLPYHYLFCDGSAAGPERARFRSDIFGEYQRVYVPINKLQHRANKP